MDNDIISELENIARDAWNKSEAKTARSEPECDGCRIIARVLLDRPFWVDEKYSRKPWKAEILRVFTFRKANKLYRVWIVGLSKSRSTVTTVRTVVEHWSTIKNKWVYDAK